MSSNDIIFILGYNFDSNYYLINGNTLVDTGAGINKDYLFVERHFELFREYLDYAGLCSGGTADTV